MATPPPPTEPPAEPQPLWQPPPALVALVAWLRRLRRGGVELLRANPRRIGAAASASLVCGLLLRKMQRQRLAMGVVRTVALSTLLTAIEDGHVDRAVVSPTACTYWLRESGKGAAGAAKAAVAATATAATATAAAAVSVAAPPTIFQAQMLPLDARLLVKLLHTHKVAFAAQVCASALRPPPSTLPPFATDRLPAPTVQAMPAAPAPAAPDSQATIPDSQAALHDSDSEATIHDSASHG